MNAKIKKYALMTRLILSSAAISAEIKDGFNFVNRIQN